MSLYNAPTGDFDPYVRYNAKAGIWTDKDGHEIENPTFVVDFQNARKAWMKFEEGQAPDVVYFPSLTAEVPQPSEKHKQGISLRLFSDKHFGGVVVFETSSMIACKAFSDLYEEYTSAGKGAQLPVLTHKGKTPIKGKHGTNYAPDIEIVDWVDRPEAFNEGQESGSANPAPASDAPSAQAISKPVF